MNYTEIMTVLRITNAGRLNSHVKILGDLIAKDSDGKYRLTKRGRIAPEMLKAFPERTAGYGVREPPHLFINHLCELYEGTRKGIFHIMNVEY
jgi:hypothetical protein